MLELIVSTVLVELDQYSSGELNQVYILVSSFLHLLLFPFHEE